MILINKYHCTAMFVSPDTPVVTRDFVYGNISVVKMEDLGKKEKWFPTEDGNKYATLMDTDVWTPSGWSKAYKIIQKKQVAQLFLLETKYGVVKVYGDNVPSVEHSLPEFPEPASDVHFKPKTVFRDMYEAQCEYVMQKALGKRVYCGMMCQQPLLIGLLDTPLDRTGVQLHPCEDRNARVYTVETADGKFMCGVGKIVLPCEKNVSTL